MGSKKRRNSFLISYLGTFFYYKTTSLNRTNLIHFWNIAFFLICENVGYKKVKVKSKTKKNKKMSKPSKYLLAYSSGSQIRVESGLGHSFLSWDHVPFRGAFKVEKDGFRVLKDGIYFTHISFALRHPKRYNHLSFTLQATLDSKVIPQSTHILRQQRNNSSKRRKMDIPILFTARFKKGQIFKVHLQVADHRLRAPEVSENDGDYVVSFNPTVTTTTLYNSNGVATLF